ncbi:ankyrin repeat domain-containing protein [Streptomyces sp. JNUCC 64]
MDTHDEPNAHGALLHTAVLAHNGDPDAAEAELARLLSTGADPDAPDEDGVTPLYHAAVQGAAGPVRLLLAAGASPDRPGGAEGLPLCAAATWGHTDAVRELLAAGARPDAPEEDGRTALGWAVRGGHHETVEALLAAGADPDLSGPDDGPPLCAAATRGSPAIVRALLDRGATAGRARALELARHWAALDVADELTASLLRTRPVTAGGPPRVSVRRTTGPDGTERVEVLLLGPDGEPRAGDSRDAGHPAVVRLLEAAPTDGR